MEPTSIRAMNDNAWAVYVSNAHSREDFDHGFEAGFEAGRSTGPDPDRFEHMRLALERLARSPLEYVGTLSAEETQAIAESGLTGHDTR